MSKYKIGDIVHTNNYGDIEILNTYFDSSEHYSKESRKHRACDKCDIKFLSNGYIKNNVREYNIIRGRVF